MPGIHVRSLGRFDRIQEDRESVLTVPGSYWLCHKNKIYKFTFKCHHFPRGAKNFPYEKELMNIIRRVIKCLPCQGQQFSTRHLLVTFNHTFWTSQDKMYAMHKFRDKPVAAPSPRAFVLTINITTSHANINPIDVKDKRSSLRLRNKNPESQDDQCASVAKAPSKSVKLNTDCTVVVLDEDDDDDNSPNCETNTTTKSLGNDIANSKDTFTKSDASPISQEPVPISANMKSKAHTSTGNTLPVDSKAKDTDVIDVNNMDVDSNSKDSSNTMESSEQSHLDTAKEPAIESANLLHRHLQDNDNSYCSNSSLISSKSMKLDPPTETQKNTPFSSNLSNHLSFTEEEEDEDFELKVEPEDVPPRSADITDLVMEGVMFTIRQDRDSVTVMEQKTKLEMDEVLENSEKVENQEGEKCLLNSSLLKLENLITKIEMPGREERRQVGWTGLTQCSPATRRVDIPSKEANLPIDYGHNRRHYSTSKIFQNMDVDSNESTTGISASEGSETESTDDGTDDTEIQKEDEYDSTTMSEEESMLPLITPNEREIGTAEVMQLKATRKRGNPFWRKSDESDSSNHNRTSAEKRILETPMISNGMACTPIPNKSFVNSQKNIYTDPTSNPDSQLSHQRPQRLIDLITANENKRLSNKTVSGPRMISSTVLTNEQIPSSLRNVIRKKPEKQEAKRVLSDEVTNTKNSEDTWKNSNSSTDDDMSNQKLQSSNVNNISNPVRRTYEDTEETMRTSPVEDKLETTITTPVTDCTTSSRELQQIDIEALVNKISGTMRPGNIRTDVNCRKRKTNSLSKRSLRQRECPMKTSRNNSSDNREFFIDMRKLVQDITRGVKVVVKRIPITDKTVYTKCSSEQKS